MQLPNELFYTPSHEWVKILNETTVRIGITDFAQRELGDIVYVDIPKLAFFNQGEAFGSVEAIKTVADLLMPVDGTLLRVNESLVSHPEKVNQSPYGEGWIVEITLSNAAQMKALLKVEEYKMLLH